MEFKTNERKSKFIAVKALSSDRIKTTASLRLPKNSITRTTETIVPVKSYKIDLPSPKKKENRLSFNRSTTPSVSKKTPTNFNILNLNVAKGFFEDPKFKRVSVNSEVQTEDTENLGVKSVDKPNSQQVIKQGILTSKENLVGQRPVTSIRIRKPKKKKSENKEDSLTPRTKYQNMIKQTSKYLQNKPLTPW